MSKKIDLTGQRFGRLVVIEELPERHDGKIMWRCKCDCGNIKDVFGSYLRCGDTKSCGCLSHESPHNYKKIIGQRFGKLTVIEDTKRRVGSGEVVWRCKCDCGNITEISSGNLKKRTCCKDCNSNFEDYSNQKFGNLTVLSFSHIDKYNRRMWKCQCDCGNISYVSTNDLGKIKSCGCIKKGIGKKNILNQKFGKLTVIEDLHKQDHLGRYLWKCRCDCGNTIITNSRTLLYGSKQSCGCLTSKNNSLISQLLEKNNIIFEQEKSFEDLFDKGRLYFDFFVDKKYIIEYDGLQHFEERSGWNNRNNLSIIHKHDLMKNKYCFNHKIPIIRIPYDTNYTIDDLELETTHFLLTPENEELYYLTNGYKEN